MSVGGWAGDTATKIFQPVEKAVVQPLNKTVDAIIRNPIPVISTIALTTVGIPYPIANAAVAAANGGSVKDIALTVASAYAGEYAGKLVGGNISAIPGVSSLSGETQRVLATIAASASGSGTAAALSGKPLDQILTATTAGAVSGLVSDQLKANNVLQELQSKGLPAETINNLIVNASNNATIAIIQGRSIADAVTTSTVATLAQSGLRETAKAISDGYQALLKNSETLQAVQKGIDDLKASAVNMFNSVINPKQQETQMAYDILSREYQDYLTDVNTYNAAVDKYNSEPPRVVAQRVVYGPGWLNGGYIRYGATGPGERQSMPAGGYFVYNPAYRVGGVGDIYVKDPFNLKPPSDIDYTGALNRYTGLAEDFTKTYAQYQGMIDEINRLSEQGNSLYSTIVADSEVLGKNVADYVVKENEVLRDVVQNITDTAKSDVETELIRLFEEEQRKASTPSPYEPIAGGGTASDVSPTPLVPTTPGGSVTVEGVPDTFQPTKPTQPSAPSGAPLTPSEISQYRAEGISDQEINELVNRLGLQPDISASQILDILNALQPPTTPTTPTAPTAPVVPPVTTPEQPVTPTEPTSPVGPQPTQPEIVTPPPPPEISEEGEAPLYPEPVTPTQPTVPPAEPISSGTTTQPPTQPTGPSTGMTDQEIRDREILDLINGGGGTQQPTPIPGGGTGTEGAGAGGELAGGGEGVGGTGGEGTAEGAEEEGEFVDTGPREPADVDAESMLSPTIFISSGGRGGPVTIPRTRGTGTPTADTTLSAILGTSLAPTSQPILGEDESKRKAVWNLESLRNALGI